MTTACIWRAGSGDFSQHREITVARRGLSADMAAVLGTSPVCPAAQMQFLSFGLMILVPRQKTGHTQTGTTQEPLLSALFKLNRCQTPDTTPTQPCRRHGRLSRSRAVMGSHGLTPCSDNCQCPQPNKEQTAMPASGGGLS